MRFGMATLFWDLFYEIPTRVGSSSRLLCTLRKYAGVLKIPSSAAQNQEHKAASQLLVKIPGFTYLFLCVPVSVGQWRCCAMDTLDATPRASQRRRHITSYLRMPKRCTAQTGKLHSATYMYALTVGDCWGCCSSICANFPSSLRSRVYMSVI